MTGLKIVKSAAGVARDGCSRIGGTGVNVPRVVKCATKCTIGPKIAKSVVDAVSPGFQHTIGPKIAKSAGDAVKPGFQHTIGAKIAKNAVGAARHGYPRIGGMGVSVSYVRSGVMHSMSGPKIARSAQNAVGQALRLMIGAMTAKNAAGVVRHGFMIINGSDANVPRVENFVTIMIGRKIVRFAAHAVKPGF